MSVEGREAEIAPGAFAINLQLSTLNPPQQLLRQEKDEASLSRVCGWDSSDAFIPRFAVR